MIPVPTAHRTRRRRVAAVFLATVVAGSSACGTSTDERTSKTTASPDGEGATAATVPETVPAGTTLRIGDQNKTLELPLTASGEIDAIQFEPEWSTFQGGPPLLEAFRAGEIDVGFVGDTPPILAAAAGQDLIIVAAWRYAGNNFGVVVPPGKDIDSLEDLKGKQLAYQRGTALQAYAVRALKEAGLTESDIEPVDLSALDVVAALKSGDLDAGVVVEPLLSQYLAEVSGARKIRDATGITTNLSLVITTSEALADPGKEAAIADLLRREKAAFAWGGDNREALVDAFTTANSVPRPLAEQIIKNNAGSELLALDDAVVGDLQSLADDLADAKVIPKKIDVSALFDRRFASLFE